jgi:hypothetical protein
VELRLNSPQAVDSLRSNSTDAFSTLLGYLARDERKIGELDHRAIVEA